MYVYMVVWTGCVHGGVLLLPPPRMMCKGAVASVCVCVRVRACVHMSVCVHVCVCAVDEGTSWQRK